MKLVIVDLFCGCGGASEGAIDAATELGFELEIYAINCWEEAVRTYKLNHPSATVLCQRVEQVVPEHLIPSRRVHLMIAGPECTHHSQARGGMPIDDQKRVPAWVIPNWLQRIRVDNLIIENVPEFRDWGPLGADGKPLKSRRGEIFRQYIETIKACGMRVEYRDLICADYGDYTTRKRLFIVGTRKGTITWPERTHAPRGKIEPKLFGSQLKPYKAARDIIDWSLKGKNIFDRKRPLVAKTLKRIAAGMLKVNGIDINPFLVKLYGTAKTAPLDKPLPTITAKGNHLALVQPFVLSQASGGAARPVEEPLPAICTKGAEQLVHPFIVDQCNPFVVAIDQKGGNGNYVNSADKPLTTVTTKSRHGLVQPFMLGAGGPERQGEPRSLDKPLPTVLGRSSMAVAEPFLVAAGGPEGQGRQPHSVDDPFGTLLTENHQAFAEPYLVIVNHGDKESSTLKDRSRSVEEPLPTLTTKNGAGLCQPYITKYYGTGSFQPVSEPLDTVTTKERFGLVESTLIPLGNGLKLGIRFRMLQDYELAAAHGFGPEFKFTKKKAVNVKLVGNSWPRHVATALCRERMKVYLKRSAPALPFVAESRNGSEVVI